MMNGLLLSFDELPSLPRDEDGPVFNEPWEAKAFALAVRLSEAGCFTWPEWVEIFSHEIRVAQERGDPDLGDTYYQHWLNALERICAAKGLVGDEDMRRRKADWRKAYLNTPHGRPIDLSTAFYREAKTTFRSLALRQIKRHETNSLNLIPTRINPII